MKKIKLLGVREETIVGKIIIRCLEEGHWKVMFPTLLERKKGGHLKVLLLEEEEEEERGKKCAIIKRRKENRKRGPRKRRNNFVVGVGKDVIG